MNDWTSTYFCKCQTCFGTTWVWSDGHLGPVWGWHRGARHVGCQHTRVSQVCPQASLRHPFPHRPAQGHAKRWLEQTFLITGSEVVWCHSRGPGAVTAQSIFVRTGHGARLGRCCPLPHDKGAGRADARSRTRPEQLISSCSRHAPSPPHVIAPHVNWDSQFVLFTVQDVNPCYPLFVSFLTYLTLL